MTADPAAREKALGAFVSSCVGQPVTVRDLVPITSVGNARAPWSFTASWAGHEVHAVLLLKAAAGQVEADLGPEFRTLERLAGTGVPAPRALWLDEEGGVLGQPFFATERVPGAASTRILRRAEDRPIAATLARQLAATAARLHALDPAPFTDLAPADVSSTALVQLETWEDRFRRNRLEPHPGLVYLFAWLRRRPPTARRISVVHGDLRFGNLLYDGDRLTAVLDWEMVHLGDPVEDLGWVYRSLWTPEAALALDEFLAVYADSGGEMPQSEHLRWYQVFSEVKHATISLTASRAFADRATHNLRHADRAATVSAFAASAFRLIDAPC